VPPRVEIMKTYEFVASNGLVVRISPNLLNLVYYPKGKNNKQKHVWLGNIKLYPLN
jgi:hypothetical protein